jgi:hypothetical protein
MLLEVVKEGFGDRLPDLVTVLQADTEGDPDPEAEGQGEEELEGCALSVSETLAVELLLEELVGVLEAVCAALMVADKLGEAVSEVWPELVRVLIQVMEVVAVRTRVEVPVDVRRAEEVTQPLPLTDELLERKGEAEDVADLETVVELVSVRDTTPLFDPITEEGLVVTETVLVLLEDDESVLETVLEDVLETLEEAVLFAVLDPEAVVLTVRVELGLPVSV